MKNYNKKIIITIILIAIAAIGITIYNMARTYAVFHSELSGSSTSQIGKWNIVINGTNISSGITQEFTMSEFTIEQSENTKDTKIAPGMTGSFEISIEPTDTEVSIKYDISIDNSLLKGNKITLVSVEETNVKNNLIKTAENTYTGVITLDQIKNNVTNNIKITFDWENDENNNEEDTAIGTTKNSKLEIPIVVKAIQYMGETIEAYEGE